MQTPIRYAGGKARLARQIVPLLTTGGEVEYREPFAGGGGVLLNVFARRKYLRLWLNDQDAGIAAYWTALLQDAERLMRRVRRVRRPTITPALFYRLKAELSQVEEMPVRRADILDLGFKKLLLHRISYSGLGTRAGGPMGGRAQRSKYAIDSRWQPPTICRRIVQARRVLDGVQVRENRCTNLDFESVIRDESCAALLYLDPPYFVKGNDLYQCGFALHDHARLADCLQSTSHSWLLSYDDCAEARHAYDWARVEEVTTTYSVTRTRPKATELLISPWRDSSTALTAASSPNKRRRW